MPPPSMPARQTGRLKGEARERESGERESVIACAAAMSSGTLLAACLHFGEVRPPRVRQEVPRVATARTKKKEESAVLRVAKAHTKKKKEEEEEEVSCVARAHTNKKKEALPLAAVHAAAAAAAAASSMVFVQRKTYAQGGPSGLATHRWQEVPHPTHPFASSHAVASATLALKIAGAR